MNNHNQLFASIQRGLNKDHKYRTERANIDQKKTGGNLELRGKKKSYVELSQYLRAALEEQSYFETGSRKQKDKKAAER